MRKYLPLTCYMSERIPPFTLPGGPANDNAKPVKRHWSTISERRLEQPEKLLTEIFMRLESEENGAWGESIRLGLLPDGSADLSEVPVELRKRWEEEGFEDASELGSIMPREGVRFLAALLFQRHIPGARFSSQRY